MRQRGRTVAGSQPRLSHEQVELAAVGPQARALGFSSGRRQQRQGVRGVAAHHRDFTLVDVGKGLQPRVVESACDLHAPVQAGLGVVHRLGCARRITALGGQAYELQANRGVVVARRGLEPQLLGQALKEADQFGQQTLPGPGVAEQRKTDRHRAAAAYMAGQRARAGGQRKQPTQVFDGFVETRQLTGSDDADGKHVEAAGIVGMAAHRVNDQAHQRRCFVEFAEAVRRHAPQAGDFGTLGAIAKHFGQGPQDLQRDIETAAVKSRAGRFEGRRRSHGRGP